MSTQGGALSRTRSRNTTTKPSEDQMLGDTNVESSSFTSRVKGGISEPSKYGEGKKKTTKDLLTEIFAKIKIESIHPKLPHIEVSCLSSYMKNYPLT